MILVLMFTSALLNRRFLHPQCLSTFFLLLYLFLLIAEKMRILTDSSFLCGWCRDRSVSGHSVTVRETVAACSVEISGVTAAYEVSGNAICSFCFVYGNAL